MTTIPTWQLYVACVLNILVLVGAIWVVRLAHRLARSAENLMSVVDELMRQRDSSL